MFLNGWAIALGVLAAGLPVAIHFLTRPRPLRVPLSTLRFVEEAMQQRRARHRLRDAIVLSLRTLAVLLIAFAVARPFFGRSDFQASDESASIARVVLLDVSQSMAAAHHGVQVFERARPLAAKQLEYRGGMKADLILAGARPTSVFTQASSNFSVLREELSRARPLPERLAVQDALNLASEILAREGDAKDLRRELVVVSDFQRSNWGVADFSVLPAGTHIELESVTSSEPPPNLGVLGAKAQGRAEAGRELRLEVEVGNYSPSPRTIKAEVQLGQATVQLSGLCGAAGKTVLSGEVLLPESGWQTGEVRLIGVDDALSADNARPLVLDVRPVPRLALVTRQLASQRPSASYFVERALLPADAAAAESASAGGRSSAATGGLPRIDPARIDRDTLAAVDLLIVVQPGRLSQDAINQLATLVRRGRGILYVAADASDATNLRMLIDASNGGLKLPVEFSPPSARQPRRNLFLAELRKDQSPFEVFGDELPALVETLRFSGALDSRRLEGGLAEDILGEYNDRSAFLAAAASETGGLLVLNVELAASNLPLSPLYVPLLGELVQRLLGQGRRGTEIACGEPFALSLPAEVPAAAELTLAGPTPGEAVAGDLADEGAGVLWKGDAAGAPGVYRVVHKNETVFAAAAAIPAAESDLSSLPASVFEERLAGGRDVRFRSHAQVSAEEHDTLWSWLAVACAACLLSEVLALRLFRT
jgi:hypothetical protein